MIFSIGTGIVTGIPMIALWFGGIRKINTKIKALCCVKSHNKKRQDVNAYVLSFLCWFLQEHKRRIGLGFVKDYRKSMKI